MAATRKRCRVWWKHSKFGYDAVLLNSRGRGINAINYGFPHPPTAAQKAEARRRLCGGGLSGSRRKRRR